MIDKTFGDIKDRLDFRAPKVENAETLRGKMLCLSIAPTHALEVRRKSAAADLDVKYALHELFDKLDSNDTKAKGIAKRRSPSPKSSGKFTKPYVSNRRSRHDVSVIYVNILPPTGSP